MSTAGQVNPSLNNCDISIFSNLFAFINKKKKNQPISKVEVF